MHGEEKMSPTIQTLGIDKLPRDVRVALVQEIWDSIAAETSVVPLSEAQRAELERRLAEDESNPDDVIPWEEVKAKALARLKQ
jgi:putative addiction module component (TIGR02574 family)